MVQKQAVSNGGRSRSQSTNPLRRKKSGAVQTEAATSIVLEVDYNMNPTKLFTYIDQSKWDKAIERVRRVPSEASTWLVSKYGPLPFRYLPLHLCLQFHPPFALVESLVDAYQEALTKKDHEGKLPLHHICAAAATNPGDARQYSNEKTTDAIVALLISLYPDGIYERDNFGKSCLDVVQNIKQREGKNSHAEAILRVIHKYEKPEDRRNKVSIGVVPDYRDEVITSTRKSSLGETSKRHNIDGGNQALHDISANNDQNSVVRLVIRELESALERAKEDKEEINSTNHHLQQENDDLKMELRKLKREFEETVKDSKRSGIEEQEIIQLYEKQMEELNQDNEECRTLLKDQTDKFDAKIRSLTSAHEAAVAEMHSSWKRHESNLDDQMKSLKAQINTAQEQLELGRATESHWRSKHSALESQLEDLKADMHRLQLGVKEKEQLLVSAFERRQFQLEADLKTSEAKLNSLQKVKMVQDGELNELRASNSELKQRDHLTKAVYEKNLLSLEEELKHKETAIQSLLHIKDIQEKKLKELHDDHDNIYRKYQQELKEVKDFYEKRITSLEKELREESSASQRLQITNSAIQKRMEELETELEKQGNLANTLQKANLVYEEDMKQQALLAEEKLEATSHSFFVALQDHETNQRELISQLSDLQHKASSLEQELLQERKASSRNEEEVKSVIVATEAKLEETTRTLMAKVKEHEAEKLDLHSVLEDMVSKARDFEVQLHDEKKANASLLKTAQTMDAELAESKKNASELEERVKDLELTRENLKDAMSKNNDTFQKKVKLLLEKRKSLESEVSTLKINVANLEDGNKILKDQVEDFKNQIQQEKRLASAKNSAEVAAERKHARVQSELRDEIAQLQEKNYSLEDCLQKFQCTQGDREAATNELESTVKNYQVKIHLLEDDNESLRQKIGDLHALEAGKLLLEKEIANLKSKVSEQEEEIRELKEKSEEKSLNVTALNTLEENLRRENKQAREKVQELEIKKTSLMEILERNTALYKKKFLDMKEEKLKLESEVERLKQQTEEAMERVAEVESKRASLKEEVSSSYTAMLQKVKLLKESKDVLEEENQSLRSQLVNF